jgi:hypothetical protein
LRRHDRQKPPMMVVPLCRLRTWVSLARAPRVRRCDAMGAVTATHGAPARWMRLAGWARLMSVCHNCGSASEVSERARCSIRLLLRVTRTHRIVARDQSETSSTARSRQCGYHVANMTTCGIANATKLACTRQGFATGPSHNQRNRTGESTN